MGAASPAHAAGLSVSKQLFGQTVEPYNGHSTNVYEYTLTNDNGMTVQVLTYGAIIRAIDVPDSSGQLADVALGFNSLQDYVSNDSPPLTTGNAPYLGEVLGRYANRIAGGRFTLAQPGGSQTYTVPINSDGSSLNGGLVGFGSHVWGDDQAIQGPGYVGVQMTLVSPNGDAGGPAGSPGCPNGCTGYPGALQVVVTYTLNDQNELSASYMATDESNNPNLNTVVNLTNASYFNLAGENAPAGSAYGQEIEINAADYTPIDTSQVPLGSEASVTGTPLDFTTPQTIGSRIDDLSANFNAPGYDELGIAQGYNFNWALNAQTAASTGPDGLNLAARAIDPGSGREMSVYTDQPGVQFDTANLLDGSLTGISGDAYRQGAGYALETQHFPDSPNQAGFPSTTLAAGQSMTTTTVWQFSAPALTLSAPSTATAGTAIPAGSIRSALSDTTADASGAITYEVFGPQKSPPSDCASGGTLVGTAAVSGGGDYAPASGFTPASAGNYYWYASYSGDAADQPTNSGCGAAMATTSVAAAPAAPATPAAPAAPAVPPAPSSSTPPSRGASLSALHLSPRQLSTAGRRVRGRCVKPTRRNASGAACRLALKLVIDYTLSGAAPVTLDIRGTAPGRRVGKACVVPTDKNSRRRRCTRVLSAGSITLDGTSGANQSSWNGEFGGHQIAAGAYTLTARVNGVVEGSGTFVVRA